MRFWKFMRFGSILKPVSQLRIRSLGYNPESYFITRSRLFVYERFAKAIVSQAEPTPNDTKYDIAVFETADWATDEEIEKSLPDSHYFSPTAVCAILATLIENDWRSLVTESRIAEHPELLYTRDWVIHLLRSDDESNYRNYFVAAARREDQNRWGVATRVYCPVA